MHHLFETFEKSVFPPIHIICLFYTLLTQQKKNIIFLNSINRFGFIMQTKFIKFVVGTECLCGFKFRTKPIFSILMKFSTLLRRNHTNQSFEIANQIFINTSTYFSHQTICKSSGGFTLTDSAVIKINLTFRGPCIVIYSCNKTNEKR